MLVGEGTLPPSREAAMIRRLLVLLPLLCVVAPARAQVGDVHLSWNDCLPKGGLENLAYACDSNEGVSTLVCTFRLNFPIAAVDAVTLDFDVRSGLPCDGPGPCRGPDLTSFWQLQRGGCRAGSITVSSDFTSAPFNGGTGCTNMWRSAQVFQGPVDVTYPVNDSYWGWYYDRIAFHTSASPIGGNPVALAAGVEYYALRIVIDHALSAGDGACDGCCAPMALGVNRLTISSGGQDFVLQTQTYPEFVVWQSFGGPPSGPCAPTIAVARSWGYVKSLYR